MKKWLKITLWGLLFTGVVLVLFYGNSLVDDALVKKPNVKIHVDGLDAFLTEKELVSRLRNERLFYEGQRYSDFKIKKIEDFVRAMPEVRNVEVFKTISNDWSIDLELIRPIARIFNQHGETFYLDSDGKKMQRSDIHTARVLIFSGEIKDHFNDESLKAIINNDSLKSIRDLDEIYYISNYVCEDPLLQSLIGQVYLNENNDFIMTPVVGDQKIVFGDANSEHQVKEKFQRLKVFYKEAIPYEGWSKYSEISLKYEGQIVCKKTS